MLVLSLALLASIGGAQTAMEDGDYARAVRELANAPESPLVHSMRAHAFKELGDCHQSLTEARAYLSQTRHRAPRNRDAHEGMLELERACAAEVAQEVKQLKDEKKQREAQREEEARDDAQRLEATRRARLEALSREQVKAAEARRGPQVEQLIAERRATLERSAAPFEPRALPDPYRKDALAAAAAFSSSYDYDAAESTLQAMVKTLEALRARRAFDDSSEEGARLLAARDLLRALERQDVETRAALARKTSEQRARTTAREEAQRLAFRLERKTEVQQSLSQTYLREVREAAEKRTTGAWFLGVGASLGLGSLVSFFIADASLQRVRDGNLASGELVQPMLDRAQGFRVVSLIGVVAGGTFASVGGIRLLTVKSPEAPAHLQLSAAPTPSGFSASLSGAF
jgi:hypothetical protein